MIEMYCGLAQVLTIFARKMSMMVQIHTLSVADFKHTMRNNDLYDSTIESMPELAVISIGNSFDDFDPDDIFSNGPSSR